MGTFCGHDLCEYLSTFLLDAKIITVFDTCCFGSPILPFNPIVLHCVKQFAAKQVDEKNKNG